MRKLQMSDQPMLLGEEDLLRILVGLVRSPAAMGEEWDQQRHQFFWRAWPRLLRMNVVVKLNRRMMGSCWSGSTNHHQKAAAYGCKLSRRRSLLPLVPCRGS